MIDSACSRTVAGVKWIRRYIIKLKGEDKGRIWIEKNAASFQFRGGEKKIDCENGIAVYDWRY